MPHWGIKWKKFCVAYIFNWLINLLYFLLLLLLHRGCFVHVLWKPFLCVPRWRWRRRPTTVTRWNIVQRNILIQPSVVSWWFLSMKAMPVDMIAIWVDRYCVVTASQLMLIGKRNCRWYRVCNVVFLCSGELNCVERSQKSFFLLSCFSAPMI